MKKLKKLDMHFSSVIDLHPLQHLYQLESISAQGTRIMDVSPLSNLTQLNDLMFENNRIVNIEPLMHHKNFSKFEFSDQRIQTSYELKFYTKILKVHSSHKQMRKVLYQNEKSRTQLIQKKEHYSVILNKQIQNIHTQLELLAKFIQNSDTCQQ
ncbi:leucine-rich_repeat domain-containing protein [Hexamita inflata]|uniref:Leucine-rich repeat domain-containing protein n=1 Tax=Hexamita inflata TaxID=28002 RepID=A0AA86UIS4_9EUKA|nr:leucine-rich repeat domain-containing protein [Hexamita inflata]